MFNRMQAAAAAAGLVIATCVVTPATAALPEPVKAMIEAAIQAGDEAQVKSIVAIAKKTNPDDVAEIDKLFNGYANAQREKAAQQAAADQENIRNAGFLDNWKGRGELGGFRSTGNTNSTGLSAALGLKRQGINWSHKLTGQADYQKTGGITSREQFLLAYEPNYQLNRRAYIYGLAQFERDRFQGFSSRISASSGLGYRVIDRPDMHLNIKAGPAWRRTKFLPTGQDSSLAGLAGLNYDWQISKTLRFTEDATAFIQSGNSTFTSVTGFEAALGGRLSARFSYGVEMDTNPPAGAADTDTITRLTLVYGF